MLKKTLICLALIAIGCFSSPAQVISVSNLNSSTGFPIQAPFTGSQVSYAGDINNDGFNELMFSTNGTVYVVYGSETQPSIIDVSNLTSPEAFTISGLLLGWNSGSYTGIGDVNGDKIDDLITSNTEYGYVCVIFGNKQPLSDIDILDCSDETLGIKISGCNDTFTDCVVGFGVARAGDVNGDGIQDMLLSAIFASTPETPQAGVVYVVYGNKNGLSNIDLTSINSTQGFSIAGAWPNGDLGTSISTAGDVNGDGIDDIMISTAYFDAFVIYGSKSGLPDIDLGQPLQDTQGFTISQIPFSSIWELSSAGDFNGDGVGDLLVGLPIPGNVYVIYGSNDKLSNISLVKITPEQGLTITTESSSTYLGRQVSSAGDVNQDGLDDILVTAFGSESYDGDPNAGMAYVIFGTKTMPSNISVNSLTDTQGYKISGTIEEELGIWGSGIGDINGDGYPDIALATNSTTSVAYVVYSPFSTSGPNPRPKFGERMGVKALVVSMIVFIICIF